MANNDFENEELETEIEDVLDDDDNDNDDNDDENNTFSLKQKLIIGLVLLLVIVIGAVAVYLFFFQKPTESAPTTASSESSNSSTPPASSESSNSSVPPASSESSNSSAPTDSSGSSSDTSVPPDVSASLFGNPPTLDDFGDDMTLIQGPDTGGALKMPRFKLISTYYDPLQTGLKFCARLSYEDTQWNSVDRCGCFTPPGEYAFTPGAYIHEQYRKALPRCNNFQATSEDTVTKKKLWYIGWPWVSGNFRQTEGRANYEPCDYYSSYMYGNGNIVSVMYTGDMELDGNYMLNPGSTNMYTKIGIKNGGGRSTLKVRDDLIAMINGPTWTGLGCIQEDPNETTLTCAHGYNNSTRAIEINGKLFWTGFAANRYNTVVFIPYTDINTHRNSMNGILKECNTLQPPLEIWNYVGIPANSKSEYAEYQLTTDYYGNYTRDQNTPTRYEKADGKYVLRIISTLPVTRGRKLDGTDVPPSDPKYILFDGLSPMKDPDSDYSIQCWNADETTMLWQRLWNNGYIRKYVLFGDDV